jgi:hypothetical protein
VTTYGTTARLSPAVLGAALGWAGLAVLGTAAGLLAASLGVAWWLLAGRRARAAYRSAAPVPQPVDRRAPA